MMQRRAGWFTLLIALVAVTVAGCAPQAASTPTPTRTPGPVSVTANGSAAMVQSTPSPTLTPAAATAEPAGEAESGEVGPTASAERPAPPAGEGSGGSTNVSAAPPPADEAPPEDAVLLNDHYWLIRPIGPAYRNYLDRTYPYGSTAGGRLRPHSGVEFFNPEGTPVLAVADATVHYAGTDETAVYGPQANFYGNLIILQLTSVTYGGQPVYVLYGHLSAIDVQAGDSVTTGQAIGAVGGTGVANGGSHLHLEVRIGDPAAYLTATRNPDLWIRPYGGYGTLAGRVSGPDGAPLPEVAIHIEGADMPRYGYTYTGAEAHPDDEFGENFTYGDLPQGWYNVSVNSGRKIYKQRVYIQADRTSWVEFVFEE